MEKDYLDLAKSVMAILAFIFATLKYFDQRKREIRMRSFKEYQEVLNLVTGRTKEGVTLTEVHQIAAIYQLREFKMFKEHFIPILDHYLKRTENENSDFAKAVKMVRDPML